MIKSFSQYVENKDIFGFDRQRKLELDKPKSDKPINPLNTEIVLGELSKLPLGPKGARFSWSDLVEWGSGLPGSVQVNISPLGAYKTIIRKKILDLEGKETWICKKVIPLHELDKGPNEQTLVDTIYELVKEVDNELEEMPIRDFGKFENFVYSLSGKLRQHAPDIFSMEGLTRTSDNDYIIYFNLNGSGLEAPTARRLEQFHVNLSYYPHAGVIRCWANDVSSPTNQHKWEIVPSRWDEFFSPAQPRKEIEDAITLFLKTAF